MILVSLGIVATAFATVEQQGTLRVSITTQIKPYRLPRSEPAPIKALIAGHVFTSTGAVPPQLTRMSVLINRHGELQPESVPSCPIAEIHPATTAQAIERCGPALVGSGHFWASVVLPEQGVYHTTGRLLAFNGTATVCSAPQDSSAPGFAPMQNPKRADDDGRPFARTHDSHQAPFFNPLSLTSSGRVWPSRSRTQGGRPGERANARDPQAADRGLRDATSHTRPEFLAQIYTTQPFPSSFVVPFRVRHLAKGRYGTELSGSLPQALGEWGFVDRIKMTLGRETQIEGKTHSYLRASCPAPKGTDTASFPLAQANFYFADGEELSATVSKSCGVAE